MCWHIYENMTKFSSMNLKRWNRRKYMDPATKRLVPKTNQHAPKFCSRRGFNISLVKAVFRKDPINFEVIFGSFKNDTYQEFLLEVLLKLIPNASIHSHGIALTSAPATVFTILEHYWNCVQSIKSRIRSKLTLTANTKSRKPAESLKLIEDIVSAEIMTPPFQDLSSHYKSLKKYFPESLLKNDILWSRYEYM